MNRADVQSETGVRSASSSMADTRLRGGWLVLARVVWGAVVVLALGLFIASIPTTFAALHMLCTAPSCTTSGPLHGLLCYLHGCVHHCLCVRLRRRRRCPLLAEV